MQGAIGDLVGLIGHGQFGSEFAREMHRAFLTDFIHLFRLSEGRPHVFELISHDGTRRAEDHAAIYRERQLWRFDQTMVDSSRVATGRAIVLHEDPGSFSSRALQLYRMQLDLGARVTVVGQGASGIVGLCMTWAGKSRPCSAKFDQIVDLAFPILNKHIEVCDDRRRICDLVSSLQEIEDNLGVAIGKSRPREVQVGARLLFGQSANQIAQELGIGKETVICHRKRLYDHLGVQNSRELLLYYLRRGWLN